MRVLGVLLTFGGCVAPDVLPSNEPLFVETLPAAEAGPDVTEPTVANEPIETDPVVDLDLDGLDDRDEQSIAERYLPYLSVAPDDACPTMGIVFRASPHALDATKVHVIYVVLYDIDCGADGHPGDDEVFAITADPLVAPPAGILAIRAIAHQDTLCGEDTLCGCASAGLPACEVLPLDGVAWPVVYASRDKHGGYLFEDDCDGSCFFTNECEPAGIPADPILLNAGEPTAQLVTDLTAAGLVTEANGWTSPALFAYDPWGDEDFGDAGNVASDLTDPAFDTPVPVCGD